jgi:protein-arginine kinase activator protein McsA
VDLNQKIEDLRHAMAAAVAIEDFEEAASIRDAIQSIENQIASIAGTSTT